MRKLVVLSALAFMLSGLAVSPVHGFSNGFVGPSNFSGTYACRGTAASQLSPPTNPAIPFAFVDSLQPSGVSGKFHGGKRTVYIRSQICRYTLEVGLSSFTPDFDRLTGDGFVAWNADPTNPPPCSIIFADQFSFSITDVYEAELVDDFPVSFTTTLVTPGSIEC